MSGQLFESAANPPSTRDIFTVSRLNQEARVLLERGLGSVWLEAEISNLSRPASGHWYFSLKDAGAQVRCAMFRTRNLLVRFPVGSSLICNDVRYPLPGQVPYAGQRVPVKYDPVAPARVVFDLHPETRRTPNPAGQSQ